MISETLRAILYTALQTRAHLLDPEHEGAFRLFNGFTEGDPRVILDVYARTIVIHLYDEDLKTAWSLAQETAEFLRKELPWLEAGLVKIRHSPSHEDKRGQFLFGTELSKKIREFGVWHAIDLTLNRDSSFYLDTRNLRRWLIENMKGKSLLNMFAYTGSLGTAAMKGGASRVVQVDLNRGFLTVAKTSYALNGYPIQKGDFIARDFFEQVGSMKRRQMLFDCVIIDPPFFSSTPKGRVDQEKESARMINKVRPLIQNGGTLIAVNNAVYISGREYMKTIEDLCQDGYLKLREIISVPEDFAGMTPIGSPLTDPSPFNHSTKIVILDVKRKLAQE